MVCVSDWTSPSVREEGLTTLPERPRSKWSRTPRLPSDGGLLETPAPRPRAPLPPPTPPEESRHPWESWGVLMSPPAPARVLGALGPTRVYVDGNTRFSQTIFPGNKGGIQCWTSKDVFLWRAVSVGAEVVPVPWFVPCPCPSPPDPDEGRGVWSRPWAP